jgi:Ca2+-transporting ATPase
MAFMTLALAQTFHLGNARSQDAVLSWRQVVSNPIALGAVALVIGLQVLAVHFAPLARVLHTEPLMARDWLVCLALSLVPAVIGQTTRRWRRTGPAE